MQHNQSTLDHAYFTIRRSSDVWTPMRPQATLAHYRVTWTQ